MSEIPSFPPFSSLWPEDRYKPIGRLYGHKGKIFSVELTADCKYLASGGEDGVKVWDMRTRSELAPPTQGQGIRGPVTCTMWIPQRDTTKYILCYGTVLGYLAFWRLGEQRRFEELFARRVGTGAEITSMACDSSSLDKISIVLATRERVVQVYWFDSHAQLHAVFSVQLGSTVPKSVAFVDNAAKDVYVFGYYNGFIHILRGDNGKIISTQETGKLIGHASICARKNQFVMDNIVDGYDMHQLDNTTYIRTLLTRGYRIGVPKQVVFGEDYKVVVGGSDHGAIYVFDRRTGEKLQTLKHAEGGLVQTVTTQEFNNVSTIVGASSSTCGEVVISLWAHKITRERRTRDTPLTWTSFLLVILHIALILATGGFIYQNTEFHDWAQHWLPAKVYAPSPLAADQKLEPNEPPPVNFDEVARENDIEGAQDTSVAHTEKIIPAEANDDVWATLERSTSFEGIRGARSEIELMVEHLIRSRGGWSGGREAHHRRRASPTKDDVAVIRL